MDFFDARNSARLSTHLQRLRRARLLLRAGLLRPQETVITFFTTAKPFHGHSAIIQRNALQSWKLLHPDVEVILFGNEEGASEVCAELGLRHEPHVERHPSGLKYLDYMFARAQEIARHDYLCYSNCDIIQLNDFYTAFARALRWCKRFLLVAQRWDTDITRPIDFTETNWAEPLRETAIRTGRMQDLNFVDFFLFPRGLYDSVPRLLVGRSYWDHWLVWKALQRRAKVLDASLVIVAIHQNHTYGYHPRGKDGTNEDELAIRNSDLAGHGKHLRAILDSTHRFTPSAKIRRTPFRRLTQSPQALAFRQFIAEVTFPLRSRLGLRRTPHVPRCPK